MSRVLLIGLLSALAAAFLVPGCGGGGGGKKAEAGDPHPKQTSFHAKATATPFAGPAPMTVKFKASTYKASGKVQYAWHFDDGTSSNAKQIVHTFKTPGYYLVLLDARNGNHNDRWNLFLGVWPKDIWANAQKAPLTRAVAKTRTSGQKRRTRERKRKMATVQALKTSNL